MKNEYEKSTMTEDMVKNEKLKVFAAKALELTPSIQTKASKTNEYVRSPITGEIVATDAISAHIRSNLTDPLRKDQVYEAMLSKIRETTKASEHEITANLSTLAKKKT
eukprot:gnl/TRDRNA2_/TRDRNA2_176889_c0_seq3.p1 gnl/TRDRNA2_/TRDRNA2_176889_c0~~gnl/TRDRNA2_/TRDRNA2_176889_c0_seq3.p1  ORF type:complete len:108 (+),score=5.32 gnl/TRDRNA2_/TRDRNA2_176889_c0_seq3:272-595(+)